MWISSRRPGERWLGLVSEVPEHQRRPFILGHYRLERPRFRHFWRLHNESGNIWTHIVASAYTCVQFSSWLSEQDDAAWTMSSPRCYYFWGVIAWFCTSVFVLSVSAQYHWRTCTVERECLCWRCLDQSACLALVIVGFFAGIPMGFHCHPSWRFFYTTLTAGCCGGTALLVFCIPRRRSDSIGNVIIAGALVGLVPAVHWLVISAEGRRAAGGTFCTSILLGLAAVMVFTKMVPECYAPGRFDLFGHSHQIWHVLIFFTIVKFGDALTTVFALTGKPDVYCA